MVFIIGAVILVVVILLLRYAQARSIVYRHAATLSYRTGIPAKQIESEMKNGNMTPGEWAARHGLDPMTFQPQPGAAVPRDRGTGGGVNDEMRPTQVAVDRLRSLADTPLAAWTSCPVCTSDLVQPFEDLQACQRCARAFTIGGMEPEARNDGETVVMSGTKPFMPVMMMQMARVHYPILVWHVRTPDIPSSAPPILPDEELEIRAFGGT